MYKEVVPNFGSGKWIHPEMINDCKKNIVKALTILRDNAKSNGGLFQARAYDKVLSNLQELKHVTCYDDVKDIEGAGKKIKEKFKEIIETGTLLEAEEISRNLEIDIKSILLNVYGIGPKKCKDLISVHKVISIQDLKKKSEIDSKLLTNAQKIGLICYEDLLERIPRSEMLIHKKVLNLTKKHGEIVGSFRRGEESSGDIDVMLNMSNVNFKDYIEQLKSKKYLVHILAYGGTKMLGICRLSNGKYRRLDIIRNDPEQYSYTLLYFTGSKDFNIAFRNHCLTLGYSLNEHSFIPEVKGLMTEEDIFKHVGLKYIEPKNRIDKSSIIKLVYNS